MRLFVLVLAMQSCLCASEIHVRIRNIGLRDSLVRGAMRETAFLFEKAGVEIRWTVCPTHSAGCGVDQDPVALTLGLLADDEYARSPATLGSALPGNHAAIFYPNVQHFLEREGKLADPAAVLGAVMAHELGHLLLGAKHTGGLLQAAWSKQDLLHINQRTMTFSPAQAERIRRAAETYSAAAAVLKRWPESREWIRNLVRKTSPIRPSLENASYTRRGPRRQCPFGRSPAND